MISRYNNLHLAFKIMLNSAYGALGNQHFRYYQLALAECITLSGQVTIRWIEDKMNQYLNGLLKTNGYDYVLASDTDSIYLCLDKLVKHVFKEEMDTKKIIDFLDKVCSEKLEPYIDKCYQELAEYTNAYAQKMKMKRESIADKGIWTAKKRYILNVYDSEGVRYSEPKLKIMGIEAIKSSTPMSCRESIKESLKIIMIKDNEALFEYIEDELYEIECDHTSRFAMKFLMQNKLPFPPVIAWLQDNGGYCDCKIMESIEREWRRAFPED